MVDFIGGAEGARTLYLLTASQALSQLSYSPIHVPELYYFFAHPVNHLMIPTAIVVKSQSGCRIAGLACIHSLTQN